MDGLTTAMLRSSAGKSCERKMKSEFSGGAFHTCFLGGFSAFVLCFPPILFISLSSLALIFASGEHSGEVKSWRLVSARLDLGPNVR